MIGADKRLIDSRDGHKYWVMRLDAGNCWMTQNLDFDGGGAKITDAILSRWSMDGSPKQYYYSGDWENEHDSLGSYYTIPSALTVCPAGWELPKVEHYDAMIAAAGFGSGAALINNIKNAPYYFLPSGYFNDGDRERRVLIYW